MLSKSRFKSGGESFGTLGFFCMAGHSKCRFDKLHDDEWPNIMQATFLRFARKHMFLLKFPNIVKSSAILESIYLKIKARKFIRHSEIKRKSPMPCGNTFVFLPSDTLTYCQG